MWMKWKSEKESEKDSGRKWKSEWNQGRKSKSDGSQSIASYVFALKRQHIPITMRKTGKTKVNGMPYSRVLLLLRHTTYHTSRQTRQYSTEGGLKKGEEKHVIDVTVISLFYHRYPPSQMPPFSDIFFHWIYGLICSGLLTFLFLPAWLPKGKKIFDVI